jgi:hypothetical protein
MKKIICLLIIVFSISCKEKKIEEKTEKTELISQEYKITGDKYFDFDELIHYQTEIEEDRIGELYDNRKTEIDKLKFGVTLDDIPNSIKDIDFIDKLESIGYKKREINETKFNEINQIFTEKKHAEAMYAACVYIYRDILIFKKKNKIIGMAKICFGCGANRIFGTKSNTEEFGQSGDYDKLEKILQQK